MSLRRSAATLAALILLAGCARERTVRIAVAVPLTGDAATEGDGIRRAVELAVEEANASGRFPFKLEAAAFDDRADPREAVNVAHLIVSDPRIVAVVGHYNSGCAIEAAKVYAGGPIAMISPSATNPSVTRQQLDPTWAGPRVAHRLVPDDDAQGEFAAEFAYRRLRKRRMAVLHDGTAYGRGLAERFRDHFAALGGRVVSEEEAPVGAKDFRAPLERLAAHAGKPEGVYFGGLYAEAGLLLRQRRELGLADKLVFIAGDGARTLALFDVAGADADGAYVSIVGVPAEELPGARKFVEAYGRRWPGESRSVYAHLGYEAAGIALAALERSGPERAKLLAELRRRPYRGLLGTTVFDEKGDVTSRVVTMARAAADRRSFVTVR